MLWEKSTKTCEISTGSSKKLQNNLKLKKCYTELGKIKSESLSGLTPLPPRDLATQSFSYKSIMTTLYLTKVFFSLIKCIWRVGFILIYHTLIVHYSTENATQNPNPTKFLVKNILTLTLCKDGRNWPINMIKAKTPKVAWARALMSGCRDWYIFTMQSTLVTYMNDVSGDINQLGVNSSSEHH